MWMLGFTVVAPLIAWDVAALVYVAWSFLDQWYMDGEATAASAVREDPGRRLTDTILLAASVASLVAVAKVLTTGAGQAGFGRAFNISLGIVSVVLSWALVQSVFTERYARLHYASAGGAIDFNGEDRPRYSDFAYVALTVAMTFQISDTDLRTSGIRRAVVGHALLSYLLGTVIIGAAVNLVANVAGG
ncbi:DUF1345 domain-containing protein [Micromonospora chalcea]|jgi:uncharacterized membrane protein|uniref:DUF1345 domain-containing protein n=2 Tax=Micromonosporaceae TaxID=28056 RepID=A0A420EKY8_9ACTN|nr:DUF1345 domain-containing protein [Micromonospora chalcea]RKF21310.1 DUF1345 domain-containing protein [Micromonospora globbae]